MLEFYNQFNPVDHRDNGPVRLKSIEGIIYENTELHPGYATSSKGIIVIASTYSGDGICLNLNKKVPDVYIISHETDYSDYSAEKILTVYPNQKLCDSFLEFLELFANNETEKLNP